MQRWPLRILLVLILATATTVAVAWGLAIRYPNLDGIILGGSGVDDATFEIQHFQHCEFGVMIVRTDSTTRRWVSGSDPAPYWSTSRALEPTHEFTIHESAYGWPALSQFHRGIPASGDLEWALTLPRYRERITGSALPVPLHPIWPGFLIDTLFYAAIWGGVFFGFTSAKRLIRMKRGRCPCCGYNLRGDPGGKSGCPECGWGRGHTEPSQ